MKRLTGIVLILLLLCACAGTPAAVVSTSTPTETPTAAPTEAPTAIPTEVPTPVPTEAPTLAPIERPDLIVLAPGDELISAPDAGNFAMTVQDEGWGYTEASIGVNLYPADGSALLSVQIMGMHVGQTPDVEMYNSLLVTVLSHLQESIGTELDILEVSDTTVNGCSARAVVSAVQGDTNAIRFYSIAWGAGEQIYYAAVTALDAEYDAALAMLNNLLSTFTPADELCSDAPLDELNEVEAEPSPEA